MYVPMVRWSGEFWEWRHRLNCLYAQLLLIRGWVPRDKRMEGGFPRERHQVGPGLASFDLVGLHFLVEMKEDP
jgi:hypothetical protein